MPGYLSGIVSHVLAQKEWVVRGGTAPRLPLNDGSGAAGVTSVTPPGASAFRTVTMRAGFLPDPWVLPDGNGAGVTGIVAQSGLEGGCSRAHSGFVLGGVSVGPRVGSASGIPGDLPELVSPQASPDPAESSNDESIDASSSPLADMFGALNVTYIALAEGGAVVYHPSAHGTPPFNIPDGLPRERPEG